MADDPLYDLLIPYLEKPSSPSTVSDPPPSAGDTVTSNYLARLSTLPLASLTSTEPQSLSQSSHSLLLSLQALSTRSHKSVITASDHLSDLSTTLPTLTEEAAKLQEALPRLDEEALRFSQTYSKSGDSRLLDRRKKAMLLDRNVDRISDILDLPSLLSSAISASAVGSSGSGVPSSGGYATSATTNYASALDLHSHIKRLHTLYPTSPLVGSISTQAEEAMRGMASNLVTGLRTQGVKLAGGMRTIGWLRRIAPELDDSGARQKGLASAGHEGGLGALFLVCRLANLVSMLEALEPLRELADQESERSRQKPERQSVTKVNGSTWSGGEQTEKYLKRYIEIFREQSFAMISMYKNIFPSSSISPDHTADTSEMGNTFKVATLKSATSNGNGSEPPMEDPLQPLPSPLASFPLHLVSMLEDTLKIYLPNIRDRASKESLLTQVLYCAGSLGRLGSDFSMILASLESPDNDSDGDSDEGGVEQEEWVDVVKKHRVLAGRLELLASGVGTEADSNASPPP
ncbi:MAG: hypothetical protein M1812_006291 [Candelaria pacifica]|nr:MAG: hypothetical protein M1812_006291 [Candelaria pacifica]